MKLPKGINEYERESEVEKVRWWWFMAFAEIAGSLVVVQYEINSAKLLAATGITHDHYNRLLVLLTSFSLHRMVGG